MTHACRDAKEALLNDSELQSVPIVVPSRGSKLLGATLKTELTQEEVQQTLVDGFFPQVAITDHPVQRNRGALTQMGLPYAQDAVLLATLQRSCLSKPMLFLLQEMAQKQQLKISTHSLTCLVCQVRIQRSQLTSSSQPQSSSTVVF